MEWLFSIIVSLLIILGATFSLLAAVGINRLPDVYCRMHSASKAGTIGSGILLVAAGLHSYDLAILARSIAGFFFLLLTAPVAAHLLAKASINSGYQMDKSSVINETN